MKTPITKHSWAACCLLYVSFILVSCSGASIKNGEPALIKEECLAAIDDYSFKEMNEICNRMDEPALKNLIYSGSATVLPGGSRVTVRDYKFGAYRVETAEGDKWWVSQEFVSR